MVEEPVYVPSTALKEVCEQVLGLIYGHRQEAQQAYIMDRVQEYNRKVHEYNGRWYNRLMRRKQDYITPYGMEQQVAMEMDALNQVNPDAAKKHPVCLIHGEYGGLEHQAKDALIQCALNDTVGVSPDMCRGISHFGIPLEFMRRPRFGFYMR